MRKRPVANHRLRVHQGVDILTNNVTHQQQQQQHAQANTVCIVRVNIVHNIAYTQ